MKIQDLEAYTGLDRATIRYYEKEGLLTPKRLENGYRDYTRQDQEHLMKIKLLRQLGLSVSKIRQLQQGSADLNVALSEQICKLYQQKEDLKRSLDLCRQLQADSVTYDTLNAQYYLNLLTMPVPGTVTDTQFRERIQMPFHPFRHFFARITDLVLVAILLMFVQAVILRTGVHTYIFNVASPIFALCYVPVEAFFYAVFATTPGKYLFGIRVYHVDGCKHSYQSGCRRAIGVFRYGWGFGILLWRLRCLWKSFKQHDGGVHPWNSETELVYADRSWKRTVAWILTAALCVSGVLLSWQSLNSAKNKQKDITIQQFSENFNEYWELNGFEKDEGMNPDGTFQTQIMADVIINDRLDPYPDLEYIMSGDYVKGFAVSDAFGYRYQANIFPTRYQIAILALQGSIPGENSESLEKFNEELRIAIRNAVCNGQTSIRLENESISVEWSITYEGNCCFGESGKTVVLVSEDQEDSSNATISMSVRIKAKD